nr:MAG TPA: hypothetical protein [Caudoviricetes sp.]
MTTEFVICYSFPGVQHKYIDSECVNTQSLCYLICILKI